MDFPDIDRRTLIAGGVVGVLLLMLSLSRRGATDSEGATADERQAIREAQLEYLSITGEAARDIAALNTQAETDRLRANLEQVRFELGAPVASRLCIPWAQWYVLPARDRKTIQQQVSNGKVVLQPTLTGMCIFATGSGIAGHQPIVRAESSSSLFGGRASVSGPAGQVPSAPQAPSGTIGEILDSAGRVIGVVTAAGAVTRQRRA